MVDRSGCTGLSGRVREMAPARRTFRSCLAPLLAAIQHATVFLSHAGMNSTMESLYYGVPLVTVAQIDEQAANAARVEELGAGRQLARADLTPQLLRETVETVAADDGIRATAVECSTAMQRGDGAAVGADALENHLS